jgi:tetratricopeptide (TPR) repeat protein
MKPRNNLIINAIVLFFTIVIIPASSPRISSVFAQGGNIISGQVLGYEREPLYDIYIELLNEYSQAINRTRTNSAGRYTFAGMGPGRYSVRVLPFGTDYEEQTQSVEIVNFVRQGQSGNRRLTGFVNEQIDFNLRFKKGFNPQTTGAVFVQDVPEAAKKLYQQAVSDLDNKKEKEGLQGLKTAIEAFPKYFVALERLGNEYVRLGYYDAAQYLFSAAVEVNKRSYRSWYGLAYCYHSLGKFQDALFAVQKSLEIYQGSAEAFLLSGILNRHLMKFDESKKHLLKAKELSKETMPLVYWYLALLYGNDLKRYKDAAEELKTFLKLQPNTKDAEQIKKLIVEFEEKAKEK